MAGFAAFMFTLATALTVYGFRRGLKFSLTWWSFTFPIGTCVTGASALGVAADVSGVKSLGVALFVVLVLAWAIVAAHTLRPARVVVGSPVPVGCPSPAPGRDARHCVTRAARSGCAE